MSSLIARRVAGSARVASRSASKQVAVARVQRASLASLASASLSAPKSASISTRARAFSSSAMLASAGSESAERGQPDQELIDIAKYVHEFKIDSALAYDTARLCLIDTLGCGLEGLRVSKQCSNLMGPVVEGTVVPNGARVPGTDYVLDPVRAAFDIGTQIRWLDFNDCFLAAEWGHPSDNLGAIMAVADYLSQVNKASGKPALKVKDILTGMIMAHEIQGCLALENSFNRVGLDHVVLVKVASTAVVSKMIGLSLEQTIDAVSHAWIDGQSLRTYRHAPNTGSRKSWAAGDACARAVNIALLVQKGEVGYPTALTVPTWGFYDVAFGKKPFKFQRPYGSYIMENVLFKLAAPAEFHAQTAVEGSLILHKKLKEMGKSSDDIKEVKIRTQEAAIRIIDKKGKLHSFADRDHTINYMTSIPLIFGRLEPGDYLDEVAADPRIDELRAKTYCVQDQFFSEDYHNPDSRSIGNAITITLKDGTVLDEVEILYPLGHMRRREEAKPVLNAKFKRHIDHWFPAEHVKKIIDLTADQAKLEATDADEFAALWVKKA